MIMQGQQRDCIFFLINNSSSHAQNLRELESNILGGQGLVDLGERLDLVVHILVLLQVPNEIRKKNTAIHTIMYQKL